MPISPANPNWIEPPPPRRGGLGCFGKAIVVFIAVALLLVVGIYFFISHGLVASAPAQLPVQELAPEALAAVQQRIDQFKNAPPAPAVPTPAQSAAPDATPAEATPPPADSGKELVLSGAEINGLIAANRKSRGHAFVSLSGDTANIRISVPSDNIPGIPRGYLNGAFAITTDGPTSIGALNVSKIRANGIPVPSAILSMTYRGQSILGYALSGVAPYGVSTAEVRDGNVILH